MRSFHRPGPDLARTASRLVVVLVGLLAALLPLPAGAGTRLVVSTHVADTRLSIVPGSATVTLPSAARFVALSWLGAHDADVRVAAARSGLAYGAPRSVGRDGVEIDGDPRTWSAVLFVPGATALRVTSSEALIDLVVSTIADRAPQVVRLAGGSRSAAAAVPQPDVVSRAEWGADESLRNPAHAANSANFQPVRKLVVHHTGDDPTTIPPSPEEHIRAIYRFHTGSRNFSDIGYNFVVAADGRVFEGRYARTYGVGEEPTGEDLQQRGVTGAHASSVNAGSTGIALLGNFAGEQPTSSAVSALVDLLAWKAERHGIDPFGNDVYDNPASSTDTPRAFPNIAGHRDVGSTECPGGLLYSMLPSIRQRVAERIAVGGFAPTPSPSPTPGPPPGGRLTTVTPTRLLDTREVGGPITGGTARSMLVAGRAGLPSSGLRAVVLNVTAVEPTRSGFLTVFPGGTARPEASSLNFVSGQVVPNLVTVGVGRDGTVSIYSSAGSTHAAADVVGWYGDDSVRSGSLFTATTPSRLLDTRESAGGGAVGPGATRDLVVTGAAGIPASGVDAVGLNVTAVSPTRRGFVTVYPAGTDRPVTSSLNFAAGDVRPNLVLAKVSPDGRIAFYNQTGSTHLAVDAVGWFGAPDTTSARGRFTALAPSRALDTRSSTPLAPRETRTLTIGGISGVPATGAAAVLLNVTVDGPSASGFLTVHPGGSAVPTASNLNFVAGRSVPNAVVVGVSDAGAIEITNSSGTTHVIVDVAGWYSRD
ncbi:MAG TPA: N-acetylmuramoyl-L-alanine amidase [Mycobacteriales bacterium]|nr:N-acetylmuramoyl-L-alanine amidase [Mycobacteriales bacterium]